MDPIKDLPYPQIKPADIMSRTDTRADENIQHGNIESYWIPFEILAIRPGFNARIVYDDIEELAESIMANGLIHPIRVDLLKEGIAYIDEGHRRYKAISLCKSKGWLDTANVPNIKDGKIMCFRNSVSVTELQRIKNQIVSNNGKDLTDLEKIRVVNLLKETYGMSNNAVAKELGWSRQLIDNLLLIASFPTEIHHAIENNVLTKTAAIELYAKVKDEQKMIEIVGDAVANNKQLKVWDVKSMNADGEIITNGNRYTNDPGVYIGGDGDQQEIQMRKTPEKVKPPIIPVAGEDDEETSIKGGGLTETKDEETWVSDVIKDLDKINHMVSKSSNEQLAKDVDRLVEFSIKKLVSIREYIQKTPKK